LSIFVGVAGVNANIPKKDEWNAGGNVSNASSNWDPRGPNSGNVSGGPMDMRSVDPRDPRTPSSGAVDMRMMDSRDQMQGNVRGVTGRLNGASADMWQHNAMQGMPGMNKIVGGPNAAGGNSNNPQWPGQVGPKDIDMSVKPGGWDSSPPAARRPIGAGNFDDGTSLWGGGGNQNRVPGVQDPMGRNNFGRNPIGNAPNPGIPPNRLPGAGMTKPDGNLSILESNNVILIFCFDCRQHLGFIASGKRRKSQHLG
jgi:hypothetical protein